MPFDRKRYPPNWDKIRARILERAGHKCERCGVANHATGARDRFGDWHDESEIDSMKHDCGEHYFGEYPKIIRIVLTTAHIGETKHDKMDCRDEVLLALCQKCHLNEDREEHAANAHLTHLRKRREACAARGQNELFERTT